jgi:acyl phosphate:glycerol-3-phosphate acyltransferase
VDIVKFVAIGVVAYLLGAIPFAKIYSRWLGKIDITRYGSGNVGGTNVLRILGFGPAAATVLSDLAKATASVFFARWLMGNGLGFYEGLFPPFDSAGIFAEVLAAFMCMVGHNWSVYIKFKGGKGVAVYAGGFIPMFPIIVAVAAVTVIPTVLITRHMSRASILLACTVFVTMVVLTVFFKVSSIYMVYTLVAAVIIIFQHRGNIARLRTGTELRLEGDVFKKKTPAPLDENKK